MQMQLRKKFKDSLTQEFLNYYLRTFTYDRMIYGHWNAGNYSHVDPVYHKCIYLKDKEIRVCHFAKANMDLYKHTFNRNYKSTSICLSCCAGAQTDNLGAFPPLPGQIQEMIKLIADICCQLKIPVGNFLSHSEAGDNKDGGDFHTPYGFENGCEKWDLHVYINPLTKRIYAPLTKIVDKNIIWLEDYIREEVMKLIMKK